MAISLEVAEAPWAPKHRLVRIGIKAREVSTPERSAANLVFLLDVSSSMDQPNKLPLVKQSLRMLVGKLRPDDRVAIVTYAGNSGLALASGGQYSGHADFFNAWNQPTFQSLVTGCLNALRHCQQGA